MANVGRLAASLKEIRIHLCQKGPASQGVRDFIEQHYVNLKKGNPNLPILIRECSGVQPKLWARFEKGKETCVPLTDSSSSDVLSKIQSLCR